MKVNTNHLSHYFTLIGIIFAGFTGLVLFSYDWYFQLSVSVATAAAYTVWGVVHHIIHKDFSLEVLLEYLVVSILGFVIIFSLVIRT